MFIKNILKAFDRDTLIEVYWMGNTYSYYVKMSDGSFGYVRYYTKENLPYGLGQSRGLMTYVEVDEQRPLYIENNKIVIYLKDVF